MKVCKKPKIKVFKVVDPNGESGSEMPKKIEDIINSFINSDEVASVVDIKINTEIQNHYIVCGGSSVHTSHKTDINIYYTVIYIPK